MRTAWIALFVTVLSISSFAAQPDLDSLFSISVQPPDSDIKQGNASVIEVTLAIALDHFVYREHTTVSLTSADGNTIAGIEVGSPEYPEPKMKEDPFDGKMKPIYDGTVQFEVPFTVQGNAELGEREGKIVFQYQGCSPDMCFFPQTREFPVSFTITEGSGTAAPSSLEAQRSASMATTQSGSKLENWLSKGYLFTYLIVFFFGILTSFTPCVYPLIPITVTIFGARDTDSRMQAFSLALTYVLGIAMMYSALGFAAARTGAVFGQIMSNPWVISGIAALFVALGASMLGAFELQLPSSWQSHLSQVGGKGYGSAFLMGLVAGIVAAPCTGPVLAGILAYVATEGNPVFGVSLLFVYSLGLGMLFLIIGTFSGLISKLPRSGRWMENVKSMFGIILFACALYFLKDVFKVLRAPLSPTLFSYVTAIVLLVIGIVLGAVHLSFHTPNVIQKLKKSVGVVLSVFALYLGFGSLTAVEASEVDWYYDLERGLEIAKKEGKPVMIDFYADWCVVCKEIDAKTYSDEQVGEALDRFVNIKVDLTADNEKNDRISKEYNIVGLPLIVFYNSEHKRLTNKRIDGFIGPEDFLEHIEDIE